MANTTLKLSFSKLAWELSSILPSFQHRYQYHFPLQIIHYFSDQREMVVDTEASIPFLLRIDRLIIDQTIYKRSDDSK